MLIDYIHHLFEFCACFIIFLYKNSHIPEYRCVYNTCDIDNHQDKKSFVISIDINIVATHHDQRLV